ncbi:Uncharacterised protein [Mycobacteroides abscessus subsp. abscessus]|nr:Uncharacterised protein [Mycobacteroides abscessus subsp. abscessus]
MVEDPPARDRADALGRVGEDGDEEEDDESHHRAFVPEELPEDDLPLREAFGLLGFDRVLTDAVGGDRALFFVVDAHAFTRILGSRTA